MLDIIHGTVCDPREPLDGESQLAMLQANERAQADLMLGLMLQVWNGLFMELCHTGEIAHTPRAFTHEDMQNVQFMASQQPAFGVVDLDHDTAPHIVPTAPGGCAHRRGMALGALLRILVRISARSAPTLNAHMRRAQSASSARKTTSTAYGGGTHRRRPTHTVTSACLRLAARRAQR